MGQVEDAASRIVNHPLVVSAKTIDRLEGCKVIVQSGAGFKNIDHQHAATRGIAVTHVPDYGTDAVTDTVMGMVLALMRGICFLNIGWRAGAVQLHTDRSPWAVAWCRPGIGGVWRRGMAVAVRARAFGMHVPRDALSW